MSRNCAFRASTLIKGTLYIYLGSPIEVRAIEKHHYTETTTFLSWQCDGEKGGAAYFSRIHGAGFWDLL